MTILLPLFLAATIRAANIRAANLPVHGVLENLESLTHHLQDDKLSSSSRSFWCAPHFLPQCTVTVTEYVFKNEPTAVVPPSTSTVFVTVHATDTTTTTTPRPAVGNYEQKVLAQDVLEEEEDGAGGDDGKEKGSTGEKTSSSSSSHTRIERRSSSSVYVRDGNNDVKKESKSSQSSMEIDDVNGVRTVKCFKDGVETPCDDAPDAKSAGAKEESAANDDGVIVMPLMGESSEGTADPWTEGSDGNTDPWTEDSDWNPDTWGEETDENTGLWWW